MSIAPPQDANCSPLYACRDRKPCEGASLAERGQGRAYGLLRGAISWARACPRSGDVTLRGSAPTGGKTAAPAASVGAVQ